MIVGVTNTGGYHTHQYFMVLGRIKLDFFDADRFTWCINYGRRAPGEEAA